VVGLVYTAVAVADVGYAATPPAAVNGAIAVAATVCYNPVFCLASTPFKNAFHLLHPPKIKGGV